MSVVIDGTLGITSPAETITTNLTFTGTGNRITGDFSNATLANRVAFQTSTLNSNSIIPVLPNGTATTSAIQMFNSSDANNASQADLRVVGSTDVRLGSAVIGTGTYLPMTFYTGGSERVKIDTSGNVGIGTASPTVQFQISRAGSCEARVTTVSGADMALYSDTTTGWCYTNNNYPLVLGTNNVERMRIDTSGRVTMPFQPAFMAYGGSTTGNSTILQNSATRTNRGSNFNTTTGVFTAPVAGVYFFYISSLSGANVTTNVAIWLNGVAQAATENSVATMYKQVSTCATLTLATGDAVACRNENSNATYGGVYQVFGGYLLG